MAKNTSVILGEHYDQFIKKELTNGTFASASEIIRNGLRLLEEERNKMELLNRALEEGENSGALRAFDNDAFVKRMHERHVKNP